LKTNFCGFKKWLTKGKIPQVSTLRILGFGRMGQLLFQNFGQNFIQKCSKYFYDIGTKLLWLNCKKKQ
jgi:hypothetical protein